MKKYILVTIAVLLFCFSLAAADEFSKVGTAGAQFLKIGMGARYIGLGEAATALVDDVYGLYWNPAALALIDQPQVAFSTVDWVADIKLNYFAFAYPIREDFTIGFALDVLSVGEMDETTVYYPDGTGRTFDASSISLQTSVSKRLTDRFMFGLNFKYISEQISEEHSRGFCFDFGALMYTGFKSLRMGVNISNLGPDLRFDGNELDEKLNPDPDNPNQADVDFEYATEDYDLPLMFKVGVAYDLMDDARNRWTVALEARDPSDNIGQFSVGSEYSLNEMFMLRAGYKFNYEEEGLTLGGGLNLNPTASTNLNFDYAWSDFGRLQSTHRFSVGLKF